MSTQVGLPDVDVAGDAEVRLLVLEMTVAAIAARLPQEDFEEVVSMLVFVAKSSEAAAGGIGETPSGAPRLEDASHFATRMLDRIAASRRSPRTSGRH
ncbi:hypothetical protein [Roseomonas indoligenes]|uniref:Uncharacterized protein n=1 Tax=Roseomonas indoligenes TaxID=2820811 RepID=A0A940MX34_9PROT|nr:hypothetical protein [Pararoseomonas indoligenes]MBP0493283.1 hypothetical protein [Pararoseomonas indoligenes]